MTILMDWLQRRWQHLVDWILPAPPAPMPMAPADRHALFAQLATLRARRAGEAAQAQETVDGLTDQWKALQTQADTLHHQLNTMQHAAFCASLDHSTAEDTLLRQIKEKGSLSLLLFVEDLDAELDILNRAEDVVLPTAHRDYVVGKKTMGLSTDAGSRRRRAAALHQARARAVEMQGELLSIESMNAELLRLRKTIPEVTNEVLHNERASIAAYN